MTIVEAIGITIVGLTVGIGVNHLSNVLPYLRSGFLIHRPVCSWCYNSISWKTFILATRCSHCRRYPRLRVWLVLFGYPVLLWILKLLPVQRISWELGVITLAYFGLVAVIDFEHRVVLNPISITGAVLGLGIGWHLHGLPKTLLGGIAGYAIMLGLYYLGIVLSQLITKIRNQPVDEVALGFGDVNLGGVLGLYLGWPGITAGLLLAIILGGSFSLFIILYHLIIHKYQMFMAIPYAPFLLLGVALLLFRP